MLRKDILSGDLPPGSRIIERFIMESTSVSRTPVRAAMRRSKQGLVIAHRRPGTLSPIAGSPVRWFAGSPVRRFAAADLGRQAGAWPYLTSVAADLMTARALESIRATRWSGSRR